jgi:hypothetical protein
MAVAAVVLLAAPVAHAGGVLSRVVGGMKERADDGAKDEGRGVGSSDGGDSSSGGAPAGTWRDGGAWGYGYGHRAEPPGPIVLGGPYPTGTDAGEVELYLGLQSVHDSDGALAVSLRSSYRSFGIQLENTRYFERVVSGRGMDHLTLDLWAANLAYRAVAMGPRERTAVWVKGGLAGARADDLQIFGAAAGAELAHNVTPTFGVDVSARLLEYQHDIRGLEARAGVAASILRLSYRVVKLNVGPPLRGTELGVALRF